MPGLREKETMLDIIASQMQGTGYVPSTRRGPDVPAGTVISREVTGPAPPPGGILLKSPIPIWGFHPTLRIGGKGGFQPGYESVTEFVFAEPEPTEITQVVSPFIPVEPKIGKDVPIETVEKYKEVIEESVLGETQLPIPPIEFPEIKLPEFPDIFGGLAGLGKYALIGIVGIVAIMLLKGKK